MQRAQALEMPTLTDKDPRRGKTADDTAYLGRVGERVRLARDRLGWTRKGLAQASGVSERYLADLEAGLGNASLIVLRRVAAALQLDMEALLSEHPEPSPELSATIKFLSQLSPARLSEARGLLIRAVPGTATVASGRIALIGLRGAGKSTIGRALAQELAVPFIELDREIERAAGMELSEIFALQGQAGYRAQEMRCLEAVVDQHDAAVIATGGGLVTELAAYDLLLATCRVVWLKAAPEAHMSRVTAQGDLRPMADHPQAMDDLRAILERRSPLYARAHFTVDTTGAAPETAVRAIRTALD
jgi:XRE family transcriptional regulator, aerobic/anaerobic benzoate catabolism transcriptional regulator